MTFEEMYNQNFRYIYNIVYMRILHRETAEDITSETFLKAYLNFDRYDEDRAKPSTWLCAIADNEIKMHFRKAQTMREVVTDEIPETAVGDEDERLSSFAFNREAEWILGKLEDKDRELISLRLGGQLSFREIGNLLCTSEKGATERYRRVIAKCRRFTEGKRIEDLL